MRNLFALSFVVVTTLVGCGRSETTTAPNPGRRNDEVLIQEGRSLVEEIREHFGVRSGFDPREYPARLQTLLAPTRLEPNRRIIRALIAESRAYVVAANLEAIRAALASVRGVARSEHAADIVSMIGLHFAQPAFSPLPQADSVLWAQQARALYLTRLGNVEAAVTRMDAYLRANPQSKFYVPDFVLGPRTDRSLLVLQAIRDRVDAVGDAFTGRVPRFIVRGGEAEILRRQAEIRFHIEAIIETISVTPPIPVIDTLGDIVRP